MDEWSTLLVRAQQGDNAAYERFLRQAVPFIKRRGRRYVNSDQLDDLVQESLLTIHRVLHSYQPGLPVEPWISGILRHKFYENRRQQLRQQAETYPEDDSWHPTVVADHADQAEALQRLLSPLTDLQAEVLYATKVEEMSVAETANMMQRSVAWVKVNVHRALVLLRNEIVAGNVGGERR